MHNNYAAWKECVTGGQRSTCNDSIKTDLEIWHTKIVWIVVDSACESLLFDCEHIIYLYLLSLFFLSNLF
jgi:hypothetical protein